MCLNLYSAVCVTPVPDPKTPPLQELQVPKTLHGPIINDGWFGRGAAWNAAEDIVVYVAESKPSEQTPAFGGSSSTGSSDGSKAAAGGGGGNGGSSGSSSSKAAAPRTWRGVAAAVEDWGELNTGGFVLYVVVIDDGCLCM